MKLSKRKLGVLVGAALSLGVAGQASADVYGLSKVQIDNLLINFNGSGSAGLFEFNTDQNARLNGVADPTDGSASCGGIFAVSNDCAPGPGSIANPRLSGTVQNAPGSTSVRAENDYQVFGSVGDYSNAEAAIIKATLLLDGPTATSAISESNLDTATTASANTLVQSVTNLTLDFTIAEDNGSFSINFDALVNVIADVNGGDIGAAQANSSLTVELQKDGVTLARWTPQGNNTVATCAAGLTCTATEAATSLNNAKGSSGGANQVVGGGNYNLDVVGLLTGDYTLTLANNTSTQLRRVVPVPGTLFLMGAGLLAGARSLRRRKA